MLYTLKIKLNPSAEQSTAILETYAEIINNGRRIRGQADLCLIDHIFYLMLVVESPDIPENIRKDIPKTQTSMPR